MCVLCVLYVGLLFDCDYCVFCVLNMFLMLLAFVWLCSVVLYH